MPVSVPTTDEFNAAMGDVTDDLLTQSQRMDALEARVAALEAGTTTPPIDPPPVGEGGGKLVAVVTLHAGGTFSYYEANATDIGAYHPLSGSFAMECRRQTLDGCPLRIDFRRIPGANGGWQSIVFELGDVLGQGTDLGGYSVDILDDHGSHHTVNVPHHWHLTRWRWQSGPWPHLRSPAAMSAAYELPTFDAGLAINNGYPPPAVYEPLGFAGLEIRMPNTGSRGDIGQVTEWQGHALCTNSAAAWMDVLAQGEAMNSFPWIMRDASTGSLLDIVNSYPNASFYPDGRTNPLLANSPGANAAGVQLDTAHQPAGSYVPFLHTEDPYFLETLQCQALFCFCEVPRDKPQMPGYGQVRSQAWSVRTLVQAWHATQDHEPRWLLPKSVLKSLIDQTVECLTWSTGRHDNLRDVFHAPDYFLNYAGNTPTGTAIGIWQDDFALGAWAWAAVMEPRFVPFATFMCHHAQDRLGGKSGWPASVPETYSLQVCDVPDAPVYDSWAHAWQVNAPQIGYDPAHPPPQLRYTSAAEFDYPNGLMASLAMVEQARRHGVDLPDLTAELDLLGNALIEGAHRVGGAIYWRSAIAH